MQFHSTVPILGKPSKGTGHVEASETGMRG